MSGLIRSIASPDAAWFADASGKYYNEPLPYYASGEAMYYNPFFDFKYRPGNDGEHLLCRRTYRDGKDR